MYAVEPEVPSAYAPEKRANSAGYGDNSSPTQMPVTVVVNDRLDGSISAAMEIRGRLWSLRDRLIGSPPPTPAVQGSNTGSGKETRCFADATLEKGLILRDTLNDIEALVSTLDNRL